MGCCSGWPVRGLNVIDELGWASLNPNFEYDGDESIALFPGYLSGDGTGTIITLAPTTNLLPYPRALTSPYPLITDVQIRSLCVAGGNVSLLVLTFATDIAFSGDHVVVHFSYQNATGTYWVEVDGLAQGTPFSTSIDTGIALQADRQDNLRIVIGPGNIAVYLNGGFLFFQQGFNFTQVGYLDMSIGYTAANRQGMIGRTQIYTAAP